MSGKKIVVIAGPNGAGKTTFDHVAMRVRQGGHDIPAETIRRRFASGRLHFHETYRGRVDSWQLFDNGGEIPFLLEEGENF